MTTRRRFGQHFLHDTSVINTLIQHIAPQEGEPMLEIGPGGGVLTKKLLQAKVMLSAIEIDYELADKLQRQFGEQLHLIVNDVLKEDLNARLENGMRVVGNLPYNISTPLLLQLAQSKTKEMWLMVQKEVAARVCAKEGSKEYGRLTISLRLRFEASYEMEVPPSAFTPPPKVVSAVLRLRPRKSPIADSPMLATILAAAFQSRRKMLGNGLANFTVNWQAANIAPSRRPQTLSPEEFARLAEYTTHTTKQ